MLVIYNQTYQVLKILFLFRTNYDFVDKNCQDWIEIFLEMIDPTIINTIQKKYGIYKFRDTILGELTKATMNSSGTSSRISSNQEIEKNLDMIRASLKQVSDKIRPILTLVPHLKKVISSHSIWSRFGFSIKCSNSMKFSLDWAVTSMTSLKTFLNDFNEDLKTFIEHLEDDEEIIEAKNIHFKWIECLLKYQVGNEKSLAKNMKQFYNNINSFLDFLDTIESILTERNARSLPRYDINHGNDKEGQDMEDGEDNENAIHEDVNQNQNKLSDDTTSETHGNIQSKAPKRRKRKPRKRKSKTKSENDPKNYLPGIEEDDMKEISTSSLRTDPNEDIEKLRLDYLQKRSKTSNEFENDKLNNKQFSFGFTEEEGKQFLRIEEVSSTTNKVDLDFKILPQFRNHLENVLQIYRTNPAQETQPATFVIKDGYNLYYLDLKENKQGRFLQISEVQMKPEKRKHSIRIPHQLLDQFHEHLNELYC